MCQNPDCERCNDEYITTPTKPQTEEPTTNDVLDSVGLVLDKLVLKWGIGLNTGDCIDTYQIAECITELQEVKQLILSGKTK